MSAARLGLASRDLDERVAALLGGGLQHQPAGGEEERTHLGEGVAQLDVFLGAAGLAARLVEGALDLGGDVGEAQQVGAGLGELQLGLVAAGAELGDPGRLLEQDAPFGGAHRQDLADAPLLDDRVRSGCRARRPSGGRRRP